MNAAVHTAARQARKAGMLAAAAPTRASAIAPRWRLPVSPANHTRLQPSLLVGAAPVGQTGDIAPAQVDAVLTSSGTPMPAALRADMETRFGTNFGNVRLHTNADAGASALAVGARAYTVGSHVVFGPGQFAPGTHAGLRTLTHELAHVAQQAGRTPDLASVRIGAADAPEEHEAEGLAAESLAGGRVAGVSHTGTGSAHALGPTAAGRSGGAVLRRARLFSSTLEICRRVLRSREFTVTQGGIVVTANAGWGASAEVENVPDEDRFSRPQCGREAYAMTLNKSGMIFDSGYGSCEFATGQPFSRSWTGLPEGTYYLDIWTNNSNPNCCLRGDIEVSEQAGLNGPSCTQPPPGPLAILHEALSLAGMIPALGAIPDGINTGIYLIQGDFAEAGISAVAIVPVLGDAATVVRRGRIAVRTTETAVLRVGSHELGTGLREARAATRVAAHGGAEALRTVRFTRSGVRFSLRGAAADFSAIDSAVGAQVYIVRDARREVVYVGMTERDGVTRLMEHLRDQPGEFLGQASIIEVRGTGLTRREALALEEDLIQTHQPFEFNRQTHPYGDAFRGAEPNPEEVRRAANSRFQLGISVGD
jgi:hypothetical protein